MLGWGFYCFVLFCFSPWCLVQPLSRLVSSLQTYQGNRTTCCTTALNRKWAGAFQPGQQAAPGGEGPVLRGTSSFPHAVLGGLRCLMPCCQVPSHSRVPAALGSSSVLQPPPQLTEPVLAALAGEILMSPRACVQSPLSVCPWRTSPTPGDHGEGEGWKTQTFLVEGV